MKAAAEDGSDFEQWEKLAKKTRRTLADLERRKNELVIEHRKAMREARAAQRAAERAISIRRKYLAGSFLLKAMQDDPFIRSWVIIGLNEYLTDPFDRALFAGLLSELTPAPAQQEVLQLPLLAPSEG